MNLRNRYTPVSFAHLTNHFRTRMYLASDSVGQQFGLSSAGWLSWGGLLSFVSEVNYQVGGGPAGLGMPMSVPCGLSFSSRLARASSWEGSERRQNVSGLWRPGSELARCHFNCILSLKASPKAEPDAGSVEIDAIS